MVALLGLLALGLVACDAMPGRPDPEDRYVRPDEVTDFETLFAENCVGCHGAGGRGGPAPLLDDPLYLAWVGPHALQRIVSSGVPGTSMPAFLDAQGGTLRAPQVSALVAGMQATWGEPSRFAGRRLPPYGAVRGRDVDLQAARDRGRDGFQTFCADCHGADGRGTQRAGSVVEPSFLALISDQGLRTAVVVGRPDLDMPAYDAHSVGRPMRDQEIEDVVAWMVGHRVEFPGRPFAQAASRVGKEP